MTIEHKIHIAEGNKGKHSYLKTLNIGRKVSQSTRLKLRILNLGRKFNSTSKEKMSASAMGKHNDEKNPAWKGDEVGYRAIHQWVERKLGKATHCSNNKNHTAKRYHWANISGEYKRDVTDWKQVCPHCNFQDGVKIPIRLKEVRSLKIKMEGGEFL